MCSPTRAEQLLMGLEVRSRQPLWELHNRSPNRKLSRNHKAFLEGNLETEGLGKAGTCCLTEPLLSLSYGQVGLNVFTFIYFITPDFTSCSSYTY